MFKKQAKDLTKAPTPEEGRLDKEQDQDREDHQKTGGETMTGENQTKSAGDAAEDFQLIDKALATLAAGTFPPPQQYHAFCWKRKRMYSHTAYQRTLTRTALSFCLSKTQTCKTSFFKTT